MKVNGTARGAVKLVFSQPMKYQEYQPHASLRDYVKCFWILEKEYTADAPNEE